VVGVDSCEVEPVEVVSVFLAPGERVNVMVKMDQQPGRKLTKSFAIHHSFYLYQR